MPGSLAALLNASQRKGCAMDTTQRKTALSGAAGTTRPDYTQAITSVQRAIWLLSYRLEEARQHHAAADHSLRQAGCCAALAIFRFIGGRV